MLENNASLSPNNIYNLKVWNKCILCGHISCVQLHAMIIRVALNPLAENRSRNCFCWKPQKPSKIIPGVWTIDKKCLVSVSLWSVIIIHRKYGVIAQHMFRVWTSHLGKRKPQNSTECFFLKKINHEGEKKASDKTKWMCLSCNHALECIVYSKQLHQNHTHAPNVASDYFSFIWKA